MICDKSINNKQQAKTKISASHFKVTWELDKRRIPNFILSLRGHTKTRWELTPSRAKENFASARPFFGFHDSSIISEFLLITAEIAMSSNLKEGENQSADSILSSKPNTSKSKPCSSSVSTSTMASSSSNSALRDQFSGQNLQRKCPPPPPPSLAIFHEVENIRPVNSGLVLKI